MTKPLVLITGAIGKTVRPVVETITGRPPQSLAEFIRTHKYDFSRGPVPARAA